MTEMLRKAHWLASYPKSGSTWVRLMLNAYCMDTDKVDLRVIPEYTLLDIQRYAYQVVAPVDLGLMTEKQHLFLRTAALLHLIVRAPFSPVILKTHHANITVLGVQLVPLALTDKTVYIVRDPRDVCSSYASHLNKTPEEAAAAMNNDGHCLQVTGTGIAHFLLTWSNHVRSWKSANVTLRYEDLKHDPAQALELVLRTFGTDHPDSLRVRRAVEATRFDKLQEQESVDGFAEQTKHGAAFFRSGKVGGWKTELAPELIHRIEADHGEMMREFNYELLRTKAA